MDVVTAISGAFDSLLSFLKPADDVVHVYDIRKQNANISIYILIGVFLLIAAVVLAIVLTR